MSNSGGYSIPYKDDPLVPEEASMIAYESEKHMQMLDEIMAAIEDFSPSSTNASYQKLGARDALLKFMYLHTNLVSSAKAQDQRGRQVDDDDDEGGDFEVPQTDDYDWHKFSCT